MQTIRNPLLTTFFSQLIESCTLKIRLWFDLRKISFLDSPLSPSLAFTTRLLDLKMKLKELESGTLLSRSLNADLIDQHLP